MLAAMASFAIGDGILKHVSDTLPLSQILVIRGTFAALFLALAMRLTGQEAPLNMLSSPAFVLRIVGELIATVFFLNALFNMPLANASAIMQALPLTVSLGAAYFFGERIGWRRISAIMVGMFGVLLIIQPGFAGFNIFSLSCLLAVFGSTLRDLATRRLPRHVPSLFVTLATIVAVIVLGSVMSLFQDWKAVDMRVTAELLVASVFLCTGFFSIVSAMRVGEVGVVTPFRYSLLLFSVLIGVVFFDEIPDTLTIAGSLIVVASGLYTLYRETYRARARATGHQT